MNRSRDTKQISQDGEQVNVASLPASTPDSQITTVSYICDKYNVNDTSDM